MHAQQEGRMIGKGLDKLMARPQRHNRCSVDALP